MGYKSVIYYKTRSPIWKMYQFYVFSVKKEVNYTFYQVNVNISQLAPYLHDEYILEWYCL